MAKNNGTDRIWKAGIMGVIVGDALGCPVQFEGRSKRKTKPVTGMIGYGTYHMPAGTWTDDGSMTLAALDSIRKHRAIDRKDIMNRFVNWVVKGDYTQGGKAFDIGNGTMHAIREYIMHRNIETCGGRSARNNGNGSLMRIMPVCLYCSEKKLPDTEAISQIHAVSGLTHAHRRAQVACGLYYFMVKAILENGDICVRPADPDAADSAAIKRIRILQKGIDDGFAFYKKDLKTLTELSYYGRLSNLFDFAKLPEDEIRSSGYVVDALEAAVWSLVNSSSFKDALLKAVNLGDDTDTVGAICGGLAGLYYGYDEIPAQWLATIDKREYAESLCEGVLAE